MSDWNMMVAGYNPPTTKDEEMRRRLLAFRRLEEQETVDEPTDPDVVLIDGGDAMESYDDTLVGGLANTTFTNTVQGGSATAVA